MHVRERIHLLIAPRGIGVLLDHYHQMLPNMFPRKAARCFPANGAESG